MNFDSVDTVLATQVSPDMVHSVLSKYMLADGFDFVLDLEKSNGVNLYDARTGERYLDLFSFFASAATGLNHPKLTDKEFVEKLGKVAVNKPSNSDVYTTVMAEFVKAFGEIAMPKEMKYLFFVEGGSVAVENGLKVAMDWKVRKNFEKGLTEEKGHQVLHFKEAFHGRTGYTLSLTNTASADKTKFFTKFEWPRITNPKIKFPLEANLDSVVELENKAIAEINAAIAQNPDDIAVIIIEPIQAEGGDNHFRPEFFKQLREIADKNDILLMYDEVQTGLGLSGKWWTSQYYAMPDIISFGKKVQVCGIMVGPRIDEVKDNCFTVPSRINSTWGGNLIDMLRATKILEIMKEENLVEHAAELGKFLLDELYKLQNEFPELIHNSRGLGLICAFDLFTPEKRGEFLTLCLKNKLAIIGCGEQTVRFRPALTITKDELTEGLTIIRKVLSLMSK